MAEDSHYILEPLREAADFTLYRGTERGSQLPILAIAAAAQQPSPQNLRRLQHEFSLTAELDPAWAAQPLVLTRHQGRAVLILKDPGGQLLDRIIEQHKGNPIDLTRLLRTAIGLAAALSQAHHKGFIHKDINPANALVDDSGHAWLTGFGFASKLRHERRAPAPPETIAGTLAFMSPEQTGRMNRSIDSRSDLYSLGVTLYEMFVGALPFEAGDAMGWIHCHIARLPVAPHLRRSEIPEPLSAIILKLLAKTPEERYQTAQGVETDLRRVLSAVQTGDAIDSFPLGARDVPDRFLIPEKLYGREKEVDLLLAAFDRVVTQGATELVLVSGYSGVGKSSVVNELHKVLVPPRGLFASGKFDQFKRDIPYATLAQAFGTLVRQILAKSNAQVARWRESLGDALGPNGSLIANLIPEIELIIGKPPPVPDLPPHEAKNRFQRVLRRFIGVFARPEHPLALFLDDLQWLDTGTLELIEHLVADPELRHVLLVGAYRDNEVEPGHPLMRTLQKIREAGTRVHDIVLAPLELDDLTALAADALHCHVDHSRPLAQLTHEKTGGNPFFAIQFITALAEENLIAFDPAEAAWKWDPGRILAKDYTENVVELMIAKINRLPEATQKSLMQLACVGNSAAATTLNLIYGETAGDLHTALWEAVRLGLALRSDDTYSFAHDRIQQAAYSLIADEHRGEVHLRIGQVLLAIMSEDQLVEHLFDVANQLNRGAALLTDHDEKAHVAAINLRAGRKAKAAAAYASAREYFAAGMALLEESDWSNKYELTFSLWLERTECELLCGNSEIAGQLIEQLLKRVASKVDEAAVGHLKVNLHVMGSEIQPAVEAALTCLDRLGIEIPAHPTEDQVQAEYEMLRQALDARPIESLIDLPLMTDPELAAATQILSVLAAPAYFADHHLFCLLPLRLVRISLQHGISRDSAYAFANLGFMLGWDRFRRHRDGYRFAKVACDFVEKHGFIANRAKVYIAMGTLAVWTRPIATAIDFVQTGFRAALDTGDLTYACLSVFETVGHLLVRNDPLDAVWRESETGLDLVQKARYRDAAEIILIHQRFIATMQGRTATFSTFNEAQFDEAAFEAQFAGSRNILMICWYWILKLKARFLSGDYAQALDATGKAKQLLEDSDGLIQRLDYFYYAALTVAALYETASADQQQAWRELLREHQEQFRQWAEINPSTFADKHALVLAEIARIEKRDVDAQRLYEQAIHLARENGFVQNEGLAHELAAQYYLARGLETAGYAHLRSARNCYDRWGAHGKVKQLDERFPRLREERTPASSATVGPAVGQLDVQTVVKASQALSSEIVLPKLIEKLLRIAVENAGAQRGLLILLRDGQPRIEAQATTGKGGVEVAVGQTVATPSDLPQSALHYTIRTHQRVLLDDASTDNVYSKDEYVRQKRSKSILCLAIVKQAQVVGALYLENNLTAGAFTPDRVAVLELLASQAAISLENAALYTDLQLQVGLLQHLPVSTWTLDPDGTPDFVNQVWLDFSGQTRDYVRSHPEAWMTAVHPLDREMAAKIFWEGVHAGKSFAFETRSLRAADGIYCWHLQQAVVLRDSQGKVLKFVGTTTDIDDQKRTEETLRQAKDELARANRVTTMGELAASLAHEISQPITGAITNANVCLKKLGHDEPNLDEVRSAVTRIARDTQRAAEIIGRIRSQFQKGTVNREVFDVNEIIRETIALLRGEVIRHNISIRTELADDLPQIAGDRVQLQQVAMNLIVNSIEAMKDVDGKREMTIQSQRTENEQILVSLSDTGIGIPPQLAEQIFDPFFTTKPHGTGMGLRISRSIVESHGGRLWAQGAPGRGATFHLNLRAAIPAPG